MFQQWKVNSLLKWRRIAPYRDRKPPAPGQMDYLKEWIDHKAKRMTYKDSLPSLSVAAVHEGKPFLIKGYGSKDQLVSEGKGRHPIGSITKIFTSIACVKLANEGQVSLDDPIQKHLPEFQIRIPPHLNDKDITSKITIRSLLQHRSGLPNSIQHNKWNENRIPLESILEPLKKEYLVHSPDSYPLDSDIAFSLLGLLVQRIAKTDYIDHMIKEVFRPLDMPNSDFDVANVLAPQRNAFTNPSSAQLPNLRDISAGGMVSTPIDMANFLIQATSSNETSKGSIQSAIHRIQSEDLGLVSSTGTWRTFLQNGSTIAHSAFCAWIPELRFGLHVSSNVRNPAIDHFARQMLSMSARTISGIYPMKIVSSKIERIPLDPMIEESIVGTYTSQIGIEEISATRGKLWLDGPAPQSEVIPTGKPTFPEGPTGKDFFPRGPTFKLRGAKNYNPSNWKFEVKQGSRGMMLEGTDPIGNMSIIRYKMEPIELSDAWASRVDRVWRLRDEDDPASDASAYVSLSFTNGYLVASLLGKDVILDPLNDDLALAPGIGMFDFSDPDGKLHVNGMDLIPDEQETE